MNKISLVTAGSYSDYRIIACFSAEEQAKKFIEEAKAKIIRENEKNRPGTEPYIPDYSIENFPLDQEVVENTSIWQVVSEADSIEIKDIECADYLLFPEDRNVVKCNSYKTDSKGTIKRLYVQVLADDKATAIKIGADLFRQYVALNP